MGDKLAIEGGQPLRTLPFPSWPVWDEREEQLLLEVLHSGHWGVLNGGKVAQFQDKFARFQGAEHALCVTSGTAELEIALRALGIGPGDEVITTPYTFVATPSAAFLTGARPTFVDIDPRTYLSTRRRSRRRSPRAPRRLCLCTLPGVRWTWMGSRTWLAGTTFL